MSLEKRGIVLYHFCKQYYPSYLHAISIAWIEAGMSLKKEPAEKVRSKHVCPPKEWEVIYGNYHEELRLCFLPTNEENNEGYWFGFETKIQHITPVFKAKGIFQQ